MLERILSRENLIQALERVEKNKGSYGVDEMDVKSLRLHLHENWTSIRNEIIEGSYFPKPVRRVEIPKPNGGVRKLGIPTVMDRFLQQAIAQILTQLYDPTFSERSFGFRPHRRGHNAVRQAKQWMKEGYRWVVDIDLEKFFDKVNHDRLMRKLSSRIQDPRVLQLIRRYLQTGVMERGLVSPNTEGTPQGGPLSPLLSNIVLDELDNELEKRGLKFVRYADDCNIYVRSKRAGLRIMESVTSFIENRLKLKVNREKSAVDRPWNRKFLGFSFTRGKDPKMRVSKESVKRLKQRIRELTSRRHSMKMSDRLRRLNRYLTGWLGYYQVVDTPSILAQIDAWIRRRLRMIRWKEWKTTSARQKNLVRLGIKKAKAWQWANSRKGYWRVAHSPIMDYALNSEYWKGQGLMSLAERYQTRRWT
ncbi:group II intron reverse transcriptase/maturase [Halalkalibacterium halodurans]|uniref:RNA-directed DNA polymerase n=2 Tax=Halalkalibacterium halodurans TaxID=86665 RepID=Q9KG88_HALH5|nr:group II intron reverse transcriptase/maturase [Halalkalibacterium halodurans]MED4083143.1 group II intron reverse transcriptase/maturase [Halalkalibacterium halodurans]MED4106978.1 group II intron reverse transcriptase/maturase [Halalkalibacterium halodurans]MED4123439.1 group II intron reverse transcriptase/maturase [Halalkalibacterium halodurans]MED4188381.1 group II intron reverse transcriptase/maturase [Halalkalibacterium halodurans]BAB03943.1 transposase (11) [Halalkalibacterium halod